MSRRPCVNTANLFEWHPPEPVVTFEPARIRAASLANEISRAISVALSECEIGREEIAQKMSDFLGQPVSLNMLDKYASEAAEEHIINLVRFYALVEATRDIRLVQNIAEKLDCIVVPKAYRIVIELAREEERERLRQKRIRGLRHAAKAEGVL